ncbi:MAG: hypothetical protein JSU82_15625 [Rhodospirillales bacterium]|nr:MAG: hypothetical protein JSU82_15625 [Rhodospirillales bacterium]
MHIVIEAKDFRRLTPETQRELIRKFADPKLLQPARRTTRTEASWKQPVELDKHLAQRLVHGLSDNHRKRLEIFAEKKGRARMKDLLAVTGDSHWRALSLFEGAMTRRLRRLIGDTEKKAHLIGWDYESTVWDKDHKEIVDGVYYVTPKTAKALKAVLLA